ncbi:MAG: hypothetical protein ACRD3W_04145 [Terriglobales bacterium]
MAHVYCLRNQYVQAEQLLQSSIDTKDGAYNFDEFSLNDQIGLMSLGLASAYLQDGKYKLAERPIKQAFRCNDVLPEAARQYAEFEEKLGRNDATKIWLARAKGAAAQLKNY